MSETYELYTIEVLRRLPDQPDGFGHNIWNTIESTQRKSFVTARNAYRSKVDKYRAREGQFKVRLLCRFKNADDRRERRKHVSEVVFGKRARGDAKRRGSSPFSVGIFS
jgi:hypothetical protein